MFQVTAGARGRVVCTGDLVTVEQWLSLDNERIDAEVRRATRSQADLELEEMTLEGMSGARAADWTGDGWPPAARSSTATATSTPRWWCTAR